MLNRVLFSLLFAALFCPAKNVSDWGVLKQLTPGTVLKINSHRGKYCRLIQVTDYAIECALLSSDGERLWVFQSQEVQQIRLAVRKPTHRLRNTLIAAAAGEAVGFVWAHASDGSGGITSHPGVLVVAALPIAAIFGAVAHHISSVGESFCDGPTIYDASGGNPLPEQ